jgi:hypothetical protein
MPFVTQSIESTSRPLALNATLVGQVSPSRAAGYYHGENNSNILEVQNAGKFLRFGAPQQWGRWFRTLRTVEVYTIWILAAGQLVG